MNDRRSEAPSAAIYPWQNGAMRERRLRINLATLLVTLVVVVGCGGGAATASLTPTPSRTPLVTGSITWVPCPADDRVIGGNHDLLCATLQVPRDYADATAGTIDLALERKVDLLLIAGDLFDTTQVTQTSIKEVVNALKLFHGQVLVIPGNHDYYEGPQSKLWKHFTDCSDQLSFCVHDIKESLDNSINVSVPLQVYSCLPLT